MRLYSSLFFILFSISLFSQNKTNAPNPFDYGKMWTFENPPKDWFKKAYNFTPEDKWFDDVRKSSLRFATWCSASFISPNGLIMTNHHCSRDVVTELQKDGENFDKTGFYANTLADERKAEGLFVEQLIMVADITEEVKKAIGTPEKGKEMDAAQAALKTVQEKYSAMEGWKGLRLQPVTYYSGGKYSLYGYKRFDDIRLVWIPELDLGFFGGDPDNFTYPRYNLDCTFWRAYDENGIPLNTSANYLKFNKNGAADGEPVFVVGNPGRTERYISIAQLEYDRDYRYKYLYKFLTNRVNMMNEEYNILKKDASKEREAQELLNNIANLANGQKAYGGILGGLKDKELFGRKVEMENYIKSKSAGVTAWDDMKKAYEPLYQHAWATTHLSPNPNRGNIYLLMFQLYQYEKLVKANGKQEDKDKALAGIKELSGQIDNEKQKKYFTTLLMEISEDIFKGDMTLTKVLDGKSPSEYTEKLIKKTKFKDWEKAEKCLIDGDKVTKDDDMMLEAARVFGMRFEEANAAFNGNGAARRGYEQTIANQAFKVFGTSLPPDATFTLRISDGVIKAYDYNGTIAPTRTTYFGLYDRHYSYNRVFPWSLPERWQNPSLELLMSPFNTVSTNDIIGGNSGSPLINKNKEAVGLIFDGNIESLPGNFIFDEKENRTVSVHAGGIYAALKYVFKGDRIVKELDGM